MYDVVKEAFMRLTVAWEGGYILWMFPDVKGYISGGFGLLINSEDAAAALPWRMPDGTPAPKAFVKDEWRRLNVFVQANPNTWQWSWKRFEGRTIIRLSKEDMDRVVADKISSNLAILRAGFSDFDRWPADAQLATLSMSWAVGPAFYNPRAGRNYWPKLTAALRDQYFRTAAVECFMNEEARNPGIIPRNKNNRLMYTNAAEVVEWGDDRSELHWPQRYEAPSVAVNSSPIKDFDTVHPDVPLNDKKDDDENA